MRRALRSGLVGLAVPVIAAGCGDNLPAPAGDAGGDPDGYVVVDAPPLGDGAGLPWVDFATSGCAIVEPPASDGGVPARECHGVAPLRIGFAPIAPGSVSQHLWTFGDGATSTEIAPEHVYAAPGRYDVTLAVSGPGGTATAARPGFVVVAPAPLGAACTAAAQCADGACVCGDGAGCEGAWAVGACAASCEAAPCADGVCARLGGAAPWSGAWCLPACASDDDCADGLACATVPGDAGFVGACVPSGALAPVGAPCAGADGAIDAIADARCAAGRCAPLGLRGACSAACAGGDCPDGSACATFEDDAVGAWCVADCAAPGVACDDPWLACVAPGGVGRLGFSTDGAGDAYCAPAPCADPGDCPAGTCAGGYCAPAP